MKETIFGQCHCGAIRWSADLPHKIVLNCHCKLCRSLSGADYSSWVVIPTSQFKILSGEEALTTYQASEKYSKSFCSKCASTIFCVNDDKFPDHSYLARGNITSEFSLAPEIQVYTDDKAEWVTIDETLPIFNP